MRRMQFGLGKILLAAAGVVGALMLIPSDDASTTQTAANARPATALSTSPELATFLDNAVTPKPAAKTADEVIAAAAAASEPGQPVAGLDLPEAPEITGSIAATPPDERAVPREFTTARSAVNMRAGPSTDHPTLFVLQPDEQVTVLARDGRWAKVEKTTGATGWVYARYLGGANVVDDEPRSQPTASEPVRQAKVEAEPPRSTNFFSRRNDDDSQLATIKLRASPSRSSPAIMEVEAGTPLRVAQRRGGWLRVVLPNGTSGWVRGQM